MPKAIKKSLGKLVKHRTSKYKNNIMEQDHRGIKSRYSPMKGFKNIWNAMFFCIVFEGLRNFFSLRNCSMAGRRRRFMPRFQEIMNVCSKMA